MAISATISLTSAEGDLTSSALALTAAASISKAGLSTAISNTSGLARKTTSAANAASIQAVTLFRGDDATTNGANKVYLKNTSLTPAEYFTVHIDQEELGRLYAGDWAFFPWNAASGTKAVFTATIDATWAVGDTWEFDGVTMVAATAGDTPVAVMAQIDALNYPNWTTTYVATEATIIFTARYATSASEEVWVTADATLDTAGDGTMVISAAAVGSRSESDISVRPSVHGEMTLEHILFYE